MRATMRGRRGERGQAMTETIILTVFAVLTMVALMSEFLWSVSDFYRNVLYVVRLPFP